MPDTQRKLFAELNDLIRGNVHLNDDPSFQDLSSIFNGNIVTIAKAVACPLDADDVSKIVIFCGEHGLSPSIKAGGYGTAGWAVGGDLIIDLHLLSELDIEQPNEDNSYTSLRDMTPVNSKGKHVTNPGPSRSGKRRREEDAELRNYDSASKTVAGYLRSPSLDPLFDSDASHPHTRRRVEETPDTISRTGSGESTDSTSSTATSASHATTATSATSVSSRSAGPRPSEALSGGDPFGYINAPSPQGAPATTRQSTFSQAPFSDWSTLPTTVITNPSLPPTRLGFYEPIYPDNPHAFVTFGAGKRQKEVDIFTATHPLQGKSATGTVGYIPYHVPFGAHPAGSSIMLLGGFGFLSRLHGLSIDNLVEVEMVLADGRIVIANENEHPDLWWALRGGGPAFGIATRYKAKAFPVPVVFAGNLIYRFNQATAPSLIKHFRDCIKGAPRELYANIILTAGPPGQDSLVVIQMCYIGPKEQGQEFLSAISSWDGERCLLNEVDEKSFLHQQDSVAQVLRGRAGRQWFIRSALIMSLPDDVIHHTVSQFANSPVGCTWLFELAAGAVADFENTCVPKGQREATFTVAALHQWDMGVDDPRCVLAAEEWIKDTLKPINVGGPYPSFLGRSESAQRTISSYGENWGRMKEIKMEYDPKNIFRNSYWPLNAAGEIIHPSLHEPPTPSDANDIHKLV